MRVTTKLGLGYALVVGLLAVVLGGLVVILEQSVRASRDLAGASGRLVLSTTEQEVRLDQIEESGRKYGITGDSGYARVYSEQVTAFDESLRSYDVGAMTSEERDALDVLREDWEDFRERWTPVEAGLPVTDAPGPADSAFVATVDGLHARNAQLSQAMRSAILSGVELTSSRARRSERVAWAGVLAAALLAAAVWLLLVRSITQGLEQLVTGTRHVASGDFSVRLNADRSDEFGQLADAFDRMAERLAELDQLKKDFLSRVSHDLKSPLATMREVQRYLLEDGVGALNERQRDLLQRNEHYAERLTGMITTLLDVARFEAEATELMPERCDLAALAEEVAEDVGPRYAASSVALEIDTPEEPVRLEADRDRLHQVVTNLLDNALEASSEGDTVRVAVRPSSDPRGGGELVVADEGPGVPDEEKEAVFERFFQGAKLKGRSVGSGLGLTLCRQIVEAHGGEIGAEDAEGGGALFRVRLPAELPEGTRIFRETTA